MKKVILCLLLYIPCISFASKIEEIKVSSEQIKKFETVKADIQVSEKYTNPFNPEEIQVDAVINSPAGNEIIIPCFYFKETVWQMRFTPSETGEYSFYIRLKDNTGEEESQKYRIMSAGSNKNGFIRINPKTYYTFLFDSGKPFRGIGENVAWTEDRDNKKHLIEKYEYYFKKLHENGCNTVRVWMAPWNIHIEWEKIGKYNLKEAKMLDHLLNAAEKYDIYIMLCLDYHGVAREEKGGFNEQKWLENPYNSKLGGPCKSASDFFISAEAKKYYKKRLRYLVARYAYSTHLLAWELWNEVEQTAGKPDDIAEWHKEMSAYLKKIDPYKHLITSSYLGDGYPPTWQAPCLDFSQSHHYNLNYIADALPEYILKNEKMNRKPHVIGEYGVHYLGAAETRINDPYNTGFHNGLWTGLFSPTPILPMTWWWDNLIDPDNLYFHFKAIHDFRLDLINDNSKIEQLQIKPVVLEPDTTIKNISEMSAKKKIILDSGISKTIFIMPVIAWGKRKVKEFIINDKGFIKNKKYLSGYLYGSEKADLKNPPEFDITYKTTGTFSFLISDISHDALIQVSLDNVPVFKKMFKLKEGEWESIEWKKEWKRFQAVINKVYTVRIPAGHHRIRIENAGLDWVKIKQYSFKHTGITKSPVLYAKGLHTGNNYYLWLYPENYNWNYMSQFGKLKPLEYNPEINIPEIILKGDYRVEWWDTEKGTVIEQYDINYNEQGTFKTKLPYMEKDIACKILKN